MSAAALLPPRPQAEYDRAAEGVRAEAERMAGAACQIGCSLGTYGCSLGCVGLQPDGAALGLLGEGGGEWAPRLGCSCWPPSESPIPLPYDNPIQVAESVPELHAVEAHTFELPQPSR